MIAKYTCPIHQPTLRTEYLLIVTRIKSRLTLFKIVYIRGLTSEFNVIDDTSTGLFGFPTI